MEVTWVQRCFHNRKDVIKYYQINTEMENDPILLTHGVKIWCDDCHSNTVNAIKNFTQHFVDLLLCRTDRATP